MPFWPEPISLTPFLKVIAYKAFSQPSVLPISTYRKDKVNAPAEDKVKEQLAEEGGKCSWQ